MAQKILIADDSAFMRLYLKRILAEAGYKDTIEAADGREAIIRFERERPDLVILDVIMPDMDGLEALHEIMRVDPKANVVMITAVGQEYMMEEASKAGVKEYITKPFEEAEIGKTLTKIIGPGERKVE